MPVATPLQDAPIPIEYRRYRHKQNGYTVKVLSVTHREGKHGWYTAVRVYHEGREAKGRNSWPATVFLETFEPVGRKMRRKSAWERL